MILFIITLILWLGVASTIIIGLEIPTKELAIWKLLCISLIVLIGTPFLLLSQVIEAMISCFVPEGWNDDDENKYG